MKLEEAISRAQEVLRQAGHPTMFIHLRETRRQPDGGWLLVYQHDIQRTLVEVTFSGQGELTGVREVVSP